jgi:hypothetical protein
MLEGKEAVGKNVVHASEIDGKVVSPCFIASKGAALHEGACIVALGKELLILFGLVASRVFPVAQCFMSGVS